MKRLPIFISNLPEMVQENYVYIDKTEQIYNLVKNKGFYFLSRPRRFGKSLLISTLKEIFLGNKKLFNHLWIGNSDYTWEKYPIIEIDFSQIPHLTTDEFRSALNRHLKTIAIEHNIILPSDITTPEETLTALVKGLSKDANKIVILIDEYDKPIIDHIQSFEEASKFQAILRSFYTTIKSLERHLHFVFLTGVSKFAKTSVFSGINNLNDISLKPEAAQLLGYTHDEIQHYLHDYYEEFAQKNNKSPEEIMQLLTRWYNGYRFSKLITKVYNPFSILYCLHDKEFQNYWYASGTPTFLITLLKKDYEYIENVEETELSPESFGTFELNDIPLVPLLFQTGYLTIKDFNEETGMFKLGFPNFEVKESFTKFIVTTLSQTSISNVDTAIGKFRIALKNNDLNLFFNTLQNLFAHIPYSILKESYYHALFQFLLRLLSLESQSEILTNTGRIDTVLITKTTIYIFELKINKKPQVALQQIKDKKYYERYLSSGKQIILIGLSFIHTDDEMHLEHSEEIFQG